MLDAGAVTTALAQEYSGAVVLGTNVTLTGTDVTFVRTVDDDGTAGNANLNINASGATTFAQAVGSLAPLTSLTTDAAGSTVLNAGLVRTTGTQTYRDTVLLGANAALTSTGVGMAGDIRFAKTVDGGFQLAVNTAGTTTFAAPVGSSQPLSSLTTDAAGTRISVAARSRRPPSISRMTWCWAPT